MPTPLFQAFWLICGLWSGVGGAVLTWFRLRKHVASGQFSAREVQAFTTGMALWIFIPCLVLWGMQLSIAGGATPAFDEWPTPQKYCAIALVVFIWSAWLYWTFYRDGAATLSRILRATSKAPAFMNSPTAIKVGVLAAVACGVASLVFKP